MRVSRTATRATKPLSSLLVFPPVLPCFRTLSWDVALFANDLALLERRGTGAVFDGAIQGYFTASVGVVPFGTRGGDGRWSPRRGTVAKRLEGVMNVGLLDRGLTIRIFRGSETGQAHAHLPEFPHAQGEVVQIDVVRRDERRGRGPKPTVGKCFSSAS